MSVAGDAPPGTASPTHGTAMFETLLRGLASTQDKDAASSVRVLPVDVYGNAENTSTFNVALGIVEALNAGATVINLSLASAGDSQLLHNVIIQEPNAACSSSPPPATSQPRYPIIRPPIPRCSR